MRRLLLLTCARLALSAAPAFAQDPTPTPTATPDDSVLQQDQVPPVSTPEAPATPCPEGADGDYSYCNPCHSAGADGDYAYCAASGEGAQPPPAPTSVPTAAVQPIAAHQLPLTGGDPLLVALFGAGLLLTGLGLRRAGPTPSG
jgi:hypothetical protein